MDFFFKVEKGTIVGGQCYSDSLIPEFIDQINIELNSKSYEYSKKGLELMCEILADRNPDNEQILSMI